jgi:hypothetical protein
VGERIEAARVVADVDDEPVHLLEHLLDEADRAPRVARRLRVPEPRAESQRPSKRSAFTDVSERGSDDLSAVREGSRGLVEDRNPCVSEPEPERVFGFRGCGTGRGRRHGEQERQHEEKASHST